MPKRESDLIRLIEQIKFDLLIHQDISELLGISPQPKQLAALKACGLDEAYFGGKVRPPLAKLIGYGGSAFGGKTLCDIMIAATVAVHIPGAQIGVFRRTGTELSGADGFIPQTQKYFAGIPGVNYNDGKRTWTFSNGSKVLFLYCDAPNDKFKYQSSQFYLLIIDEATHMPWTDVEYLRSRVRSGNILPGYTHAYPFTLLTSNPGNIGHGWFKSLFISNVEPYAVSKGKLPTGALTDVVFIPAKMDDNKIGMELDPAYEETLDSLNPALRAMLRDGNWEVAGGLYFAGFFDVDRHVEDNMELDPKWRIYGAVDYGFGARLSGELPWIYHLYGVDNEGVVHVIDEVGQANTDPVQQILAMQDLEATWGINPIYRVGCRGMFVKKALDQQTIAETYCMAGMNVIPTSVTSIANAEQLIITHLTGNKIIISRQCHKLIEQLCNIPISSSRPTITDQRAEDHAIETLYSFLSSRPSTPKVEVRRGNGMPTTQELEDMLTYDNRRIFR